MRKLAIAVALATTVLATPAVARDNSGYVGVEAGGMVVKNFKTDYQSATLDIDSNHGLDFHHKVGFDADLVGGWDFGMFRLEGEVAYKHAGLKEIGFGPQLQGVDLGGFYNADGSVHTWSGMINGLVDFGDAGWAGYLGGGIGLASVHYNAEVNDANFGKPTSALPNPPISTFDLSGSDSGLAWQLFGHVPSGWARVQAIVDYVHNRLSFGYGYARSTRTAAQAHDERVGVCRDFAHLAITLCRCMNIPARYVNGYLGDIGVPADPAPMDFSAWMEVFLDGKWYTFDPRHNRPRTGRVVIARGRDATDVPLLHSFGPHRLSLFKVWTYEQEGNLFNPPHHGIDRTVSAQMLA